MMHRAGDRRHLRRPIHYHDLFVLNNYSKPSFARITDALLARTNGYIIVTAILTLPVLLLLNCYNGMYRPEPTNLFSAIK